MSVKSARKPSITKLHEWLKNSRTNSGKQYLHILLTEYSHIPDEVWDELFTYIDHAHEGARSSLRAPLGESLNPIMHGSKKDPAYGYPHKFSRIALQGFFGEILTGIIVEHYKIFESDCWEVPVYLFRTHVTAFQQLEEMKQSDNWEKIILGRTGDDGLAFERDENGKIIRWVACEAKCTTNHSSQLIKDNHKKLSKSNVPKPVDLLRTIDALKDYDDDEYSQEWIEALRNLYFEEEKIKRCDLSVYICAKFPKKKDSWISCRKPHEAYAAKRQLTSVEVHINDLKNKIIRMYARMEPGK